MAPTQTIEKKDLISIRDYDPKQDHNFILATWLRGLYYGDSWFSIIPKNLFMVNYHAALERLLSGPVTIKVACLREEPNVILGYSVTRKLALGEHVVGVLDWVFVKSAWRKIGIAKALVPSNVEACSHLTKSGLAIMRQKKPSMVFNPFIL